MILATKGFGVKVGPSKWNFGFQWPDRAGPKMANPELAFLSMAAGNLMKLKKQSKTMHGIK
jgi:hypothetical protein